MWEYVLSPLQAELCLDAQTHRVCLIGHSHVALSFSRTEGEPATGETRGAGDELDLEEGEWLINPGSVGQPRDGDPRAAWLELDTDGRTAAYHRDRVRHRRRGGGDPRAPGCPIRSPNASPTGNECAPVARPGRLTETQPGNLLKSGGGWALRIAQSWLAHLGSRPRLWSPVAAAPACSLATRRTR